MSCLIGSVLSGTLAAAIVLSIISLIGGNVAFDDLQGIVAFSAVVGGSYGLIVGALATAVTVLIWRAHRDLREARLILAGTCAAITVLAFCAFPVLTVLGAFPMAALAFALAWVMSLWALRPLAAASTSTTPRD